MLEALAFLLVAPALLYCAVRVISSDNLVHTVLWLALTLGATSVVFLLLSAPFLAGIQIILYTGGILTLMLFGVMLTHRDQGFTTVPNPVTSGRGARARVVAAFSFVTVALALLLGGVPDAAPFVPIDTKKIGEAFLTEHVLAFEILSVLLLAAVLGAIVIARRQDPVEGTDSDLPPIPPRRPLPRGEP